MQDYSRIFRDMEAKEIVVESGRSMRKQLRKLTVFLLAFYLPFAILTCILSTTIKTWIHDYIAQFVVQLGPFGTDSGSIQFQGAIFQHHRTLICWIGPPLAVIYVALYYLMLASTILVMGASFQTRPDPKWNRAAILISSLDRAWRMLLTDALILTILLFTIPVAFFLYLALLYIISKASFGTLINLNLGLEIMGLETLLFVVWDAHFLLTVSLVRPVAAIERLWGKAAIRRSTALLQGRKMTAITVLWFCGLCANTDNMLQTLFVVSPIVAHIKWVLPLGFLLSLSTMVFVYLLVTTVSTIFYFSCRSNDVELEPVAFKPISKSDEMLPLWSQDKCHFWASKLTELQILRIHKALPVGFEDVN